MIDFIIPYRNRPINLETFTKNFPDFAKAKSENNTVTVIEQEDGDLFNYGALCNVGFQFLENNNFKNEHFAYFPVDMLPTEIIFYDDKNHTCYSTSFDGYIYPKAFVFRKEFYKQINGFSNSFKGYGREDDNLFRRIDKFERLSNLKMEVTFLDPENLPKEEFKNFFLNHNSGIHPPPECGLSSIKWVELGRRQVNNITVVTVKIFE